MNRLATSGSSGPRPAFRMIAASVPAPPWVESGSFGSRRRSAAVVTIALPSLSHTPVYASSGEVSSVSGASALPGRFRSSCSSTLPGRFTGTM